MVIGILGLFEQVVLAWAGERLNEEQAALIRDNLLADLADYTRTTQEAADRLDWRTAAIGRTRRKWAEKAFEDSVPDDIAKENNMSWLSSSAPSTVNEPA